MRLPRCRTGGNQIWMRREAVPGFAGSLRPCTPRCCGERADRPCRPVADARSNKRRAGAGAVLQPDRDAVCPQSHREDIDDVIAAHANAARLAVEAASTRSKFTWATTT
ncbi:oxidoreductase domain protein [Mycobacterium xenopi 4042]|uniref:Oxidoreductase domain protein n=1 Tax=Mycobacterium xenopi 4042 TaxID=1299334 RepID=X7ZPW2_MYCXE|nr:oxidoreductase domain protein [Mycobacterium xenopi 4042]